MFSEDFCSHAHCKSRFMADEIYTVRQIVNPILQAEWDLRWASCVPGHVRIVMFWGMILPFSIVVIACMHACMVNGHTGYSCCHSLGVHACRYLEHERKKHEEEARIMKNVSLIETFQINWLVFR